MEATNSSTLSSQLQEEIAVTFEAEKKWTATLHFDICLPGLPLQRLNIFDYIGRNATGSLIYLKQKIYFDKLKYSASNAGWNALLHDLQRAAHSEGTDLVANGYSTQDTTRQHRLRCSHFRAYQPQKQNENTDPKEYRATSLHNDRGNTRGSRGKTMIRRTKTARPLHHALTCPMNFAVHEDSDGFHFVGCSGSACHENHVRIESYQKAFASRLVEEREREIIESIGQARSLNAVGRNVHFVRCERVLSRSQIRHLTKLSEMAKGSLDGVGETFSDMDSLLHYFDNNSVSYSILKQTNTRESEQLIAQMAEPGDANVFVHSIELNKAEFGEMSTFARERRAAEGLTDEQELGIAIAWMLPEEKRLFLLFPYVVHIDATMSTNNEGRPLLTVSIRDSFGRQTVVLRVFLPNQQGWVFKWMFQVVLPSFLGKDCVSRIQEIITDGDSQEISQLDAAIQLFFPSAQRVRCAWHIVSAGFKKHWPSKNSISNKRFKGSQFDAVTSTVRNWIYSWAQPDCETELEFRVSKILLYQYLRSETVVAGFGQENVERIFKFIRASIETVEQSFCFYLRKDRRHFDTCMNTAHEGTNNGMKYCAAPVQPCFSVNKTAQVLSQNAVMSNRQHGIVVAQSLDSTKLWSNLPTSQYLTPLGEGLVVEQWKQHDMYEHRRVGQNEFHVRRRLPVLAGVCPIPRYRRIRVVCIKSDQRLYCSCCYFERVGIGCRHILKVMAAVSHDPYLGYTHRDISVFWWNQYAHYGCTLDKDGNVTKLSKLLMGLRNKDVTGALLPSSNLLDTIPVEESWACPEPVTCTNYKPEQLNAVLETLLGSSDNWNCTPAGLTQETVVHGADGDTLSGFDDSFDLNESSIDQGKRSLYDELYPVFIDMINICEDNVSQDEREEVKAFLRGFTNRKVSELTALRQRKRSHAIEGSRVPGGTLVSSNPPCSKKLRTHGQKGQPRKRTQMTIMMESH